MMMSGEGVPQCVNDYDHVDFSAHIHAACIDFFFKAFDMYQYCDSPTDDAEQRSNQDCAESEAICQTPAPSRSSVTKTRKRARQRAKQRAKVRRADRQAGAATQRAKEEMKRAERSTRATSPVPTATSAHGATNVTNVTGGGKDARTQSAASTTTSSSTTSNGRTLHDRERNSSAPPLLPTPSIPPGCNSPKMVYSPPSYPPNTSFQQMPAAGSM